MRSCIHLFYLSFIVTNTGYFGTSKFMYQPRVIPYLKTDVYDIRDFRLRS